MKWAALACAVLAVLLIGSGARADSCEVKLDNGSVAVWQGQCRDGMPYGKGELTYDGRTYKGVAEDGQSGGVRFNVDADGRPDARLLGGRRPDGNAPQGQAAGQGSQGGSQSGSQGGSGGSGLAGGNTRKPADGAEAGPQPSATARGKYRFREYNAVGGSADAQDKGEPAGDGKAGAPPASAARRSEPPAPVEAVPERPARAYSSAAPCKLEVFGKLHDWSGPCTGDGKAYGQGRATRPDGSTYTGSAQNGKRHGFGTMTTPDGGWFQGGFLNGLAHGWGTFRHSDGNYYKARFEKGEQVGEKTPVEFATLGDGEADDADRGAGGAAESDPWKDTARGTQDDVWGPDTATAGSGADSGGADRSGGDVPSYVNVLGKLIGVLVPGAAADDEYVAAVGELDRREAARRAAARRAAEREAAAVNGRNADKRPQRRAARRDEPEPRRAAASNRNLETDRARRAHRDRQRRSAERRRKSQALLQRNLKLARLQRQLNRDLSSCNLRAADALRASMDTCSQSYICAYGPLGAACRRLNRNRGVRCRNKARRDVASFRSQCKARARSAYRRNVGHLMTQRY